MLKGKRVASMVGYVFVVALCAAFLFSSPVGAVQKGGAQNVGGSNGGAREPLQEKSLQAVEQGKRLDTLEKEFGEHRAAEKEQREGVKDAREALDKRLDKRIDDLQSRITDIGTSVSWFGVVITIALGFASYFGYGKAVSMARESVDRWFNENEKKIQNKIKPLIEQADASAERIQSVSDRVNDTEQNIKQKFEEAVCSVNTIQQAELKISEVVAGRIDMQSASESQKEDVICATNVVQASKYQSNYTLDDIYAMACSAFFESKYYHAVAFFDDVLSDSKVNDVLKSKAMNYKGLALSRLGGFDENVEMSNSVIDLFGKNSQPEVREQVARAYYNKGVALYYLKRIADAVDAYDEVSRVVGDSNEKALLKWAGFALVNKGVTVNALGRHDEALSIYDEVISGYGESDEPSVRESVARALTNKAITLDNLGRSEEALPVYEEVVSRFGDSSEPSLREQVEKARTGIDRVKSHKGSSDAKKSSGSKSRGKSQKP